MREKFIPGATWFLLLLLCFACNPIKVVTRTQPETDLSRFPTYEFRLADIQNQRDKVTNEINLIVLKEAIRKELDTRGYVASQNASLEIFIYAVGARTEEGGQEKVFHPDVAGGWFSYEETKWAYTQGNLVVEFVEPQSGRLLWHGQASAVVEETQEGIEKQIAKAVKKMFREYPLAANL